MLNQVKRRLSLVVAALMAGGVFVAPAVATAADSVTALGTSPRVFEQAGPYQVTEEQGGPDHTLFYPSDIATANRQHPILIWGNGTGASVSQYAFALSHLASWGFVVAAANTGQSGDGVDMLAGADFLIAEDKRAGSPFYGKIDESKIGAAGHSQGGGGAIVVGADSRVDTTIPIMPGPQGNVASLKGPSFFVAGQFDFVVPSPYVYSRYSQATQVPAVFGELKGADHLISGQTRYRLLGAVTAWFRFWLSGDANARSVYFGPTADCGICQDTAAWSRVERNAKAQAIPG